MLRVTSEERAWCLRGAIPARSREAEALLIGKPPHRDRFGEAAQVGAMALDPESDVHASAQYRKEVAVVLGRRALEQAANRAFLKTGTLAKKDWTRRWQHAKSV